MDVKHGAIGRTGLLLSLLLALFLLFPAARAEDAASLAASLLSAQAEKQTDPWVLAILRSEPRDAHVSGESLLFTLRGYDPGLKALGSYSRAADPDTWREELFRGFSEWNLEISVPLEDGVPGKKAGTLLMKDVKQAAKNAKAAFTKKDVLQALTDLLYCAPTNEKKVTGSHLLTVSEEFAGFIKSHQDLFPCESPVEWAPAFHPLEAFALSASQGPEKLVLSWRGMDYEALITTAYDEAALALAGVSVTERLSLENVPVLWRSTLAETCVSMCEKKGPVREAEFSLDDLMAGKLPEGYLSSFASYTPAAALKKLTDGYPELSPSPCLEFPKAGVNTAASRGRNVKVTAEKEGRNTYVQFCDADTGVLRGDAFVTPGKSVNVKIPEGSYVVRFASGSTWYGLSGLFGPLGTYQVSDPIIVAKPKWTLTAGKDSAGFTLHEAKLSDFTPGEDLSVTIKASLEPTTPVGTYLDVNPVLPEYNPFTGLPASDAAFTPIVMVLDNAEDAYPHWGVSEADIIFQVPDAGSGVTRLLALYSGSFPEQAGPVRSARATMLPVVQSFLASFAFAGPPILPEVEQEKIENVDLLRLMRTWGLYRANRVYNLLLNDDYKERMEGEGYPDGHNLSCHVKAIHDHLLEEGKTGFEVRSFLFTDEPREDGEAAGNIRLLHRGLKSTSGSNSASRSVFNYDPSHGVYTRTNSSGLYRDRSTGEVLTFANVIVLRVGFEEEEGLFYLRDHLTGSGSAEIFQNGRYVRGAWVRTEKDGRLILTDPEGSELRLQRGRSFIILTNDITDVIYAP